RQGRAPAGPPGVAADRRLVVITAVSPLFEGRAARGAARPSSFPAPVRLRRNGPRSGRAACAFTARSAAVRGGFVRVDKTPPGAPDRPGVIDAIVMLPPRHQRAHRGADRGKTRRT